ncbi:MAG: DUF1343 domain-containing protein [Gemmatimonadaceae bacterium]|nr:DUF1343 domain-containing protein [Chitinophagaceae bacterium]
MHKLPVLAFLLVCSGLACAQPKAGKSESNNNTAAVRPAAERLEVYLPMIKGRRVAVFANQTSMVGNQHLVDTLQKLGVNVRLIFGPEHGFRGTADAGEKIGNYVDKKTGIPVVSLYGAKRRPAPEDLKDIDIMIFDIQDVGIRFYTYISSLEEYMESAFENGKPLLLLDRPNPNGFYVDGPVLDKKYKSFVGMQPVPIVYGMTIAEYAMMLAGEKWLSKKANDRHDYYKTAQNSADTPFHFQIIKCQNYTHKTKYVLPVKPSPNLPEIQSIYLYPSTCFFEGTTLSEGRGTSKPFQIFGHPSFPKELFSFTPAPNEGAKNSKLYGVKCFGWNLSGTADEVLAKVDNRIQLKWLLEAYRLFPKKDSFFILPKSGNADESFFNKLAGNGTLINQIKEGKSETDIKKSWEPQLTEFKAIRKKYLLYPDFE